MATYVECGQTRILIDPGASLGASRFKLPPAEEEWEALKRANDRIGAYATRADVVFVSHYHEDHFRYDPALYGDKNVWAKDPTRMVGVRQAARAALLWKALEGRCRLDAAEGRRMETPDAVLTASPPLAHGADGTELGYVVAADGGGPPRGHALRARLGRPGAAVARGHRLSHPRASDASLSVRAARLPRGEGGIRRDRSRRGQPPAHRGGHRLPRDHGPSRRAHPGCAGALRAPLADRAVATAAEFLGLPERFLEARRHQLWAARRKAPAPMPTRTRLRDEPRQAPARPAARRCAAGANAS